MEHYVTLFDSLFMPQGLALHMSMERVVKDYILWILCVDDVTYDVLKTLKLRNVRLLRLSELETEELLQVKTSRSKGEYCWTLTPFAPRFVFETDSTVRRVTYIDADLWFLRHPECIFKELDESDKGVLITDHGYAADYDYSATSGKYCVQFMTFTKEKGEVVRKWWEQRCLEWCYAKYEDGKFGDQKYLDDWPRRFIQYVHVLSNQSLMLAPWNAKRFPYSDAIVWHFHALRIVAVHKDVVRVYTGEYDLPQTTIKYIYRPYLDDLAKAISALSSVGFSPKPQFNYSWYSYLKTIGRRLYQLSSNLLRPPQLSLKM